MQLSTKLRIDRIAGSFLVWVLLALRSRPRSTASAITPDQIVVLKLLGIGSIVQASPLLAALKHRYGNARFVFVTKTGNDELTRRIPLIDETETIDDSSIVALITSLWRTLRELRKARNTCFI